MQANSKHESVNAETGPVRNEETSGRGSIYPELNPWLKNSLFWLGLIFVVAVFFLHNVSGYS